MTARPLRAIAFASWYAYSPGNPCAAARVLRGRVKTGDVQALLQHAIRMEGRPDGKAVGEADPAHSLVRFFPDAALLVPLPGSRPSARGPSRATESLAAALLEAGIGRGMWLGLRRILPVRKSATAHVGARPTLRTHFDTLSVEGNGPPAASHLVLVDDVVTKGRTLLAAALRLRQILPLADLRAFALLRTLGYAAEIDRFLTPCVGTIEQQGEDACRRP